MAEFIGLANFLNYWCSGLEITIPPDVLTIRERERERERKRERERERDSSVTNSRKCVTNTLYIR